MLNLYVIYRIEMLKFVPPKMLKRSASVLTPAHLRPISHFALSEIILTFAGSLQNAGSARWAASFHIFNIYLLWLRY